MFEENEISIKSAGGTELVKRALAEILPSELTSEFQVICSRVRQIENDKIRVYWIHDLPEDPETNHIKNADSRDRFHKIVFCGNWQYNNFVSKLNIPQDDKLIVIDNPINPIAYTPKPKDEIRLIYTSTPQRGLALLVPVFEKLCETYDNIYLDVFSSFDIYGWSDSNEPFKELFEKCKNHPKIVYHGFQPNSVVRDALQKAHIFAYPSIWQECNSCATIEAMSAGLLCLHPNYAGLSDTTGGLTAMYQYEENPNLHANKFYHLLNAAIKYVNTDDTQNYLRFVKMYADNRFNISKISAKWEDLFRNMLAMYPTAESRAVPQKLFRYRT